MDKLPELPFERLLSYLNLAERLRLSAVSKNCYEKVHKSRVQSLCYSEHPIGLIRGRNRWASGAFVDNFISSTRLASFFEAFGPSVLSSLKHLGLCDLSLDLEKQIVLITTMNSFSQLEELHMIRVKFSEELNFILSLPMLTSIHLQELSGIREFTLDTPKLRRVRVMECSGLGLGIVHGESVESFINTGRDHCTVMNLRNLKILHKAGNLLWIEPLLLSSLRQLKEINTNSLESVSELFKQKRRYGLTGLKIYYCGLLLNKSHDPAIKGIEGIEGPLNENTFVHFVVNSSRLASEIPFYRELNYSIIERVALGLEVDVLRRLPELNVLRVNSPVRDVQRFLDLLKNCCVNIVELHFEGDQSQPQDLFDRLPEHCAIQYLSIHKALAPSDLEFIYRIKHLIRLEVRWQIPVKLIRKAFEQLPFLSCFRSREHLSTGDYREHFTVETDGPEQFRVSVDNKMRIVSDLNAAIEFIAGKRNVRTTEVASPRTFGGFLRAL